MEKKIDCGGCAPPVYVECEKCEEPRNECECGYVVDPVWEKAWDDKSPQRGS